MPRSFLRYGYTTVVDLIVTLNGLEPEAYLRDVITRIFLHPVNRLHELIPWNWAQPATQSVAA